MYLHYSNKEGLDMTICKICGKKITLFSKIPLCTIYGDTVHIKCALIPAKNYERALNYEKAIEIYEQLEQWEEAGRCRRLQQKEKTAQTKVDIEKIDQSTRISDSVIQRSSIRGNTQKKIQICPYCGEELNFPETPRYCPYCRKQILI